MKTYHPESRSVIWALVAISLVWGTHPVRAGGDAADEVSTTIRPEAIRADMRFLADDLLEGRQTGITCQKKGQFSVRFCAQASSVKLLTLKCRLANQRGVIYRI